MLQELVHGSLCVVLYFLIAVIIVFLIRLFGKLPNEVFRKLLHFVLLGSLVCWTVVFQTWWVEVISVILFVVIVYPILKVLEHIPKYSAFVTERNAGELKKSLVIVFLMFIIVIINMQGILDDKYLTLASIMAWGPGDAMAALIGKRFGKHKLAGKKSLEGSLAMFITSFLSVLLILYLRDGWSWILVGVSCLVAFGTSVIELYTKDGMDTLYCPLVAMIVLLLLY